MSCATVCWIRLAFALQTGLSLAACEGDRDNRARGERPLDGLERATARNVSIETAIEAMQQRDVKKLKMLNIWVRKRDKTALLGDDDLSSLDLAIDCLEQNRSPAERALAFSRIKSGKLKSSAQALCIPHSD